MALNNEESLIEVGSKVPVSKNDTVATGGQVSSNISREPVTTKMVITPFISPDTDEVKLKIDQDVAGLGDSQVIGSASELAKNSIVTTTRKIKTSIVVNSGDTAVLGGLMSDSDSDSVTKVPILGDIPVLGWLFKQEKKTKVKSNLVVFITPKIIRTPSDSAMVLENKINERIDFIQKNMNGRDPHGHYVDELPRAKTAKPSTPQQEEAPAVESF
jgi:general secretion pathway protein D